MLVWYATYQLAHLDIRHAVTKAHWHNPAMCELPEDWRSGLGGDEVDDGREDPWNQRLEVSGPDCFPRNGITRFDVLFRLAHEPHAQRLVEFNPMHQRRQ
jgi:hypothetical protein